VCHDLDETTTYAAVKTLEHVASSCVSRLLTSTVPRGVWCVVCGVLSFPLVRAQATLEARRAYVQWLESPDAASRWRVYIGEQPWALGPARCGVWRPMGEPVEHRTATLTGAVSPELGSVATKFLTFGAMQAGDCVDFLKQVHKVLGEHTKAVVGRDGAKNVRRWVVIMDDTPLHRKKQVVEYLEAADLDYHMIPAHSPQLNPVESVFAAVAQRVKCNWKAHPVAFRKPGTGTDTDTGTASGMPAWEPIDPAEWSLARAMMTALEEASTKDLVARYEQFFETEAV